MTSPGPINRPSFWYFRVNRFARWNSALPGDDVTGLTNRWRGLGHHVPRDAARQGVRAAVPDDEVLPSQALAVTVTECPKAALWERPPLSTWAFPPSRRPRGFARPSRYAPPLIAIAWQWWIASSGDPDPADSARTIITIAGDSVTSSRFRYHASGDLPVILRSSHLSRPGRSLPALRKTWPEAPFSASRRRHAARAHGRRCSRCGDVS